MAIKLNILGISQGQSQTGTYALILSEENGTRRIPVIIGGFEAQAIAIVLEGLNPPRPLTHDLFNNVMTTFDINLTKVDVHRLEEGIFHAQLHCEQNGQTKVIDARTSDAIALAIRFKCPIYTTAEIMEAAGIELEQDEVVQQVDEDAHGDTDPKSKYEKLSETDLNEKLVEVIDAEDYEEATLIRDELQRRKK